MTVGDLAPLGVTAMLVLALAAVLIGFSKTAVGGVALISVAIFAAVLVGSRFAADRLGSGGVYAAGIVAGSTDVDTIALSMAELAGTQVAWRVASTAVVLGLFSNTVVKGAMAALLGGAAFGRTVALAFGAMAAGGLLGLALSWLG